MLNIFKAKRILKWHNYWSFCHKGYLKSKGINKTFKRNWGRYFAIVLVNYLLFHVKQRSMWVVNLKPFILINLYKSDNYFKSRLRNDLHHGNILLSTEDSFIHYLLKIALFCYLIKARTTALIFAFFNTGSTQGNHFGTSRFTISFLAL